jgi:dephospho-CoA kinase
VIKIGLTGGIAGGKSQTGRYLAELGAHVIDADRVAHEAYAPGTDGFEALTAAFGHDIVGTDGVIDRAKLGARVFGDPSELARLTAIVWPLTRRLVEKRAREQAAMGTSVLVIEAALLFEAEWQDMFDEVWLVEAPRAAVLARLRDRGIDAPEAERRLASATDPAQARRLATRVLENDGSLEDLRRKVAEAWKAATAAS